jgi:hypothetical protein
MNNAILKFFLVADDFHIVPPTKKQNEYGETNVRAVSSFNLFAMTSPSPLCQKKSKTADLCTARSWHRHVSGGGHGGMDGGTRRRACRNTAISMGFLALVSIATASHHVLAIFFRLALPRLET